MATNRVIRSDNDLIINGLTYPKVDGSANQVLKTDGSGALSFTTVSSLSGADVVQISDQTDATNYSGTEKFIEVSGSMTFTDIDFNNRIISSTTSSGNLTFQNCNLTNCIITTSGTSLNLRILNNSNFNKDVRSCYILCADDILFESTGSGNITLRSSNIIADANITFDDDNGYSIRACYVQCGKIQHDSFTSSPSAVFVTGMTQIMTRLAAGSFNIANGALLHASSGPSGGLKLENDDGVVANFTTTDDADIMMSENYLRVPINVRANIANQSISSGSATLLEFTSENFDKFNQFDSLSGGDHDFTASFAGIYKFSVSIRCTDVTASTQQTVFVFRHPSGGTETYYEQYELFQISGGSFVSFSDTINLARDEQIRFKIGSTDSSYTVSNAILNINRVDN